MHQHCAIDDTIYFGFAANLTTGAAGDGATPLFDVRLCGGTAGAAPVFSGTPTLLTSASYTDGLHEIAIPVTVANGFAAGSRYLVFATLTISSITPAACVGGFTVAAIPANMTLAGGATVPSGAIPNAVAGAAGGLQIAGSNAATTYATMTVTGAATFTGNVLLSDGLTIAAPSTGNRAGLDITGNGTGAALKLAAGATGKGIAITTTAGDGLSILPTAGSAIVATGNGTSKHGIIATGGTAGTSDGATFIAGSGGVDFRANQTGSLTGSLSGSVGSVTGLTASNLDATVSSRATPAQVLTTALTESYAADGAEGTLSQILYEMKQFLTEKSISDTTLTAKKLDGSTTAATYTLDSSTAPTSITRAT